MNKLKGLIIFMLGAAVGAAVTWKAVKETYEQYADEEIASVKKAYEKRAELDDKKAKLMEQVSKKTYKPIDEDRTENKTIIKSNAYVVGSVTETEEEPYVISPDVFGDKEEYDTASLFYYEDDILTDYDDNRLDNIEDIIGYDSLSHFGEYEDDTVYVRNDRRKTDYEVIRRAITYTEVLNDKPYKRRENE